MALIDGLELEKQRGVRARFWESFGAQGLHSDAKAELSRPIEKLSIRHSPEMVSCSGISVFIDDGLVRYRNSRLKRNMCKIMRSSL